MRSALRDVITTRCVVPVLILSRPPAGSIAPTATTSSPRRDAARQQRSFICSGIRRGVTRVIIAIASSLAVAVCTSTLLAWRSALKDFTITHCVAPPSRADGSVTVAIGVLGVGVLTS